MLLLQSSKFPALTACTRYLDSAAVSLSALVFSGLSSRCEARCSLLNLGAQA